MGEFKVAPMEVKPSPPLPSVVVPFRTAPLGASCATMHSKTASPGSAPAPRRTTSQSSISSGEDDAVAPTTNPHGVHASAKGWILGTAAVVVLLIISGVFSTIGLSRAADDFAEQRAVEQAKQDGKQVTAAIQSEIDKQILLTSVLADLMVVDERGALANWDLIGPTLQNHASHLVGVSVLRTVAHAERDAWERNMSSMVGSSVNIRDREGGIAGVRPVYTVFQHVEPFYIASTLQWVDAATLPNYPTATAALDENTTTFAGVVNQYPMVFLAMAPIKSAGKMWGILAQSIDINPLLQNAYNSGADPDIGVCVSDRVTGTSLFCSEVQGTKVSTETLSYAQLKLDVVVTMAPRYVDVRDTGLPFFMRTVGVVLTAVVAIAIMVASRSTFWHFVTISHAALDAARSAHTNTLRYVCHEMRNPLHAVIGFLSLAADAIAKTPDGVSKDLMDSIRAARSQAAHMQNVLDDVLDIRAIEAGRITIHPSIVNVNDTIRDVGNQFCTLLAPSVELHVGADAVAAAWLDAGRVRQILTNAVHNAYKFTERGVISLTVQSITDAPSDTTWLLFQVCNDGAGLASGQDWAARLRARAATKVPTSVLAGLNAPLPPTHNVARPAKMSLRENRHVATTKSTGLGLRLCRRIVRRMDGWMALDDQPSPHLTSPSCNVVTRFWFAIPITVADADRVEVIAMSGSTAPASPIVDDVDLSREHVLLVDDDSVNRLMGARFCRTNGIKCSVLEDGVEALEAFSDPDNAPPYTCILLDIVMRRSNGDDVCKKLRSMGINLPIYAMTGNVDDASRADYHEAGFTGMLGKPYSKEQLAQAVAHGKRIREGGTWSWFYPTKP